jgi:hypothetical protein
MNNQKGFVNIAVVIGIIIVAGVVEYFLLIKKPLPVVPQPSPTTSTSQLPTPTPPITTSTPTKTPVTQTPPPKDTTVNKQGIFGTVSIHIYGCGQPPPDGSGCDMTGTNEVVGEGEKVIVNVADKIDSYGNVNSQHTIATYYTNQKGTYRAYLNPGEYIMCARNSCSNMITVESGKFIEVNLSIDMRRP